MQFIRGNAEDLSALVPVEPYDLIYSFGVIHHTPHPERVIEQFRKYLRPGTTVKVMVYQRRSWKVLWILLGEGKGQVLAAGRPDGQELGSADRVPGYLRLFASRGPAMAGNSRLACNGDPGGSYLSIPDRRLRAIPLH